MGRTLETYRMLLERDKNFWIKRTKRSSFGKEAQHIFDQAQKLADAATYWSPGLVSEKIIFTMLFSQYISLKAMINETVHS